MGIGSVSDERSDPPGWRLRSVDADVALSKRRVRFSVERGDGCAPCEMQVGVSTAFIMTSFSDDALGSKQGDVVPDSVGGLGGTYSTSVSFGEMPQFGAGR